MELHKRVVKCASQLCLKGDRISALSSCAHEAGHSPRNMEVESRSFPRLEQIIHIHIDKNIYIYLHI